MKNIEDETQNTTRFVIMSKNVSKPKGQFDHYQTFELEEGTKFRALNKEQAKLYVAKAREMSIKKSK
mgnify:CR=1 FL=1